MEFEAGIIKFLQSNASNGWITTFQVISMFGSYLGFCIVFFIIFIKNKRLSFVFALTFAAACVFNYALKRVICRHRPFVDYAYIYNFGNEDGFSMPSGHSVCAGLFASFLIYHLFTQSNDILTRVVGSICMALLTVLIAFSRVMLGAHYLTDTIVGIIIGIIFAILAVCVYNICRRKIWKGARGGE
ncbi:MAG: phosphatase PAP2 family protein [Clostridia bacterium]|nr:phosphatase PAP2 family protein [Clostridia bacterium]